MMRPKYGRTGLIEFALILCVCLAGSIGLSSCAAQKELVSYVVDGEDYYVTDKGFQCFSPEALNEIIQVRIDRLGR